MNKAEAYKKLISITKNQIDMLKEDNESGRFSQQIEMRQEILKSFENHLKALS
jgi:hypothetical protein